MEFGAISFCLGFDFDLARCITYQKRVIIYRYFDASLFQQIWGLGFHLSFLFRVEFITLTRILGAFNSTWQGKWGGYRSS